MKGTSRPRTIERCAGPQAAILHAPHATTRRIPGGAQVRPPAAQGRRLCSESAAASGGVPGRRARNRAALSAVVTLLEALALHLPCLHCGRRTSARHQLWSRAIRRLRFVR